MSQGRGEVQRTARTHKCLEKRPLKGRQFKNSRLSKNAGEPVQETKARGNTRRKKKTSETTDWKREKGENQTLSQKKRPEGPLFKEVGQSGFGRMEEEKGANLDAKFN